MDQATLASSIERIAIALERIADALQPQTIEAKPHIEAWKPDVDGVMKAVAAQSAKAGKRLSADGRVERKIRSLIDEGFTTYTGIAAEMNRRGLTTDAGKPFHDTAVRRLMKQMGIDSPLAFKNRRSSKFSAPVPAAAGAEPDPDPDPASPLVPPKPAPLLDTEADRKRRERNARYMAPQRRHHAKSGTPRDPAEDDVLIAAALAAGKVTHCPPFQGADGFNYRTGMFEE